MDAPLCGCCTKGCSDVLLSKLFHKNGPQDEGFVFFSTQDGMSYNGVELITIELSQQYWVWACLIQRIN